MCPFECFVHSDLKSKLTFSGTSVHRGVITLEFRVRVVESSTYYHHRMGEWYLPMLRNLRLTRLVHRTIS